MESLFWIESAGFDQHYSAAYPRANSSESDEVLVKKKQGRTYYRLVDDFVGVPSTSKQNLEKLISAQAFQSLPLSIPDCDIFLNGGKQFTYFNVYMAGLKTTSRTFAEFENLHSSLKTPFHYISRHLPQLPQDYVHFSGIAEIESYCQDLEKYLYELCRIKVIAESDYVQEFLSSSMGFDTAGVDSREHIRLSDRVFLNFPAGRHGDKSDLRMGGDLDFVEDLVDLPKARSSKSSVTS